MVIAIVGILAAVVIASLNGAREKARNTKRESDMHQIYTALMMYHSEYGCLPTPTANMTSACGTATGTYAGAENGGWDLSNINGFIPFLETAGFISKVPVDPINDITSVSGTGYGYAYYCYPSASANPGLSLRYFKEPSRVMKVKNISGVADPSFDCR